MAVHPTCGRVRLHQHLCSVCDYLVERTLVLKGICARGESCQRGQETERSRRVASELTLRSGAETSGRIGRNGRTRSRARKLMLGGAERGGRGGGGVDAVDALDGGEGKAAAGC